jgi:predicted metalloprotease
MKTDNTRRSSNIGISQQIRDMQGQVVPESFTPGSAMQRAEWFRRGLDSGSMQACDTFSQSPGA